MSQRPSLSEALRRASNAETLTALPTRLQEIITALEAQPDIHPNLTFDVFNILKASLELAAAVTNKSYPVEAVISNVCALMSSGTNILTHASNDRPGQFGFGLMHSSSRKLIPGFFYSQAEAATYITKFGDIIPPDVVVVPVKITSQHLPRPLPPINQIPVKPVKVEQPISPPIADQLEQLEFNFPAKEFVSTTQIAANPIAPQPQNVPSIPTPPTSPTQIPAKSVAPSSPPRPDPIAAATAEMQAIKASMEKPNDKT